MQHEKFHYRSLDEVRQKLHELQVELPLSVDTDILASALDVGSRTFPNRFMIQPMEGCDASGAGTPSDLTLRRYRRFAQSGAALIWVEAAAIVPEGRGNPRQLMLTEENFSVYQEMVHMIKELCMHVNGFEPVVLLQLTHSGRYSKPAGTPAPVIAYQNPLFEKEKPLPDSCIVSDDRLWELIELYGDAACRAERAGFDGVDIKACHRYLACELLSAYTRPGPFGGDFENRTRFLREAVAAARAAVRGGTLVTTRMNLYDGYPRPYGWGAAEDSTSAPDMSEPIALARRFHEQYGMQLIDFTLGNPYTNPHVNRPFDAGAYTPPEHPLEGVARACRIIGQVKQAVPGLRVVSSENTYLRQFSPNLAAGMISQGLADLAGFGRMAFAYPDFARDFLKNGALDSRKCCIACSKCTELMRANSVTGCVVRDAEVYLPLYRAAVLKNEKSVEEAVV